MLPKPQVSCPLCKGPMELSPPRGLLASRLRVEGFNSAEYGWWYCTKQSCPGVRSWVELTRLSLTMDAKPSLAYLEIGLSHEKRGVLELMACTTPDEAIFHGDKTDPEDCAGFASEDASIFPIVACSIPSERLSTELDSLFILPVLRSFSVSGSVLWHRMRKYLVEIARGLSCIDGSPTAERVKACVEFHDLLFAEPQENVPMFENEGDWLKRSTPVTSSAEWIDTMNAFYTECDTMANTLAGLDLVDMPPEARKDLIAQGMGKRDARVEIIAKELSAIKALLCQTTAVLRNLIAFVSVAMPGTSHFKEVLAVLKKQRRTLEGRQ